MVAAAATRFAEKEDFLKMKKKELPTDCTDILSTVEQKNHVA